MKPERMNKDCTESLDVINKLIVLQELYEHEFYIVNHSAEMNWRQLNSDVFSKIANIKSGIKFNNHKLISIKGNDLIQTEILNELTSPGKPVLSLASKVKTTDGEIYHLPMMNIHLNIPLELTTLNEALHTLISGEYYLMCTDRYFHVYGSGLMPEEEWKKWNLKFLMVDFLVSPRYVGHSLERGFNLLRINSTEFLKTTTPHLVMKTGHEEYTKYQEVKKFAIIKHSSQLTINGKPYFQHLFAVEEYAVDIARETGLPESDIFIIRKAAVLHDSIEDTNTDYEDIVKIADTKVADIVAILSNDKRKPKGERDQEFLEQIKKASLQVQTIKLADIYSNLTSINRDLIEGKDINVDYLKKADLFLSVLDVQLQKTSVYKNCKVLTERMILQDDYRYRHII